MIWFARRSLSWMSGRISQRIVVAVIGSLPCTLEVFCRHAGSSASVVHALARLREDYFDAVGPERRLTPFCPVCRRTVICKGDGLLDCIGFNGSGQFSYFVRDDREFHFRLLLYRVFRSRMTSTTRRLPRASSTTVAALPAHHLSEWPRLKIEITLDLQPQGAANRFEF